MIRRIVRFAGRSLLVLVALIGLYLLAAWLLAKVPVNAGAAQPKDGIPIYLLSNGVHTDLVLPLVSTEHDWRDLVDPTHAARPDSLARWVAFGWGDKGFYLNTPTWADLTASTALKAAFGLGGTAMHLTYHRSLAEGLLCHRILLSPEGYAKLVAYISSGFARDAAGGAIRITGAHYTTSDVFYEAVGRYHLFHTCNGWTNNGLKACGAKACLWTPFQSGVMDLYAIEP
jgi:uncharacterized protein (TIGR02117 family)